MLTKVITKISYNSYIKYEKDIELIELLNYLHPKLFKSKKDKYVSTNLYIYSNIEEYVNRVDDLVKFIKNKAKVSSEYKEYNYVELTLFNFLTNKDRKVIDYTLAITLLKESILDLIVNYNSIINNDNNVDRYNKRILTNYINHLTNVVKYLIEYSLK